MKKWIIKYATLVADGCSAAMMWTVLTLLSGLLYGLLAFWVLILALLISGSIITQKLSRCTRSILRRGSKALLWIDTMKPSKDDCPICQEGPTQGDEHE